MKLNCRFCGRECASTNGLRSHETTCSLNPARVKGKRGDPWKNVTPERRSLIASTRNKKRDPSVNAKISATCLKKAACGEWHHGAGRSKKPLYKGIRLDSSWELRLVEWLDMNRVVWVRNKERFPYEWRGKTRSYLPDFFLPETSTYIEVKGFTTERDLAKWASFPHRLEVFDLHRFKKENIVL